MVEGVIGLRAKLQLVLFAEQREVFSNRQIPIGEAGSAQDVAVPDFLPCRIRKRRFRRQWIAEQLNCAAAVGMKVDIECGIVAIEDGKSIRAKAGGSRTGCHWEGKPGVPGDQTRDLPAANDLIGPAGNAVGELLSPPKGKIIDGVGIDGMGDIEFGISPAGAEIRDVAENCNRINKRISI